jgi:hypothetical protein
MIYQTNDKRYVKDGVSTAVLNIDEEGFKSFKLERDRILQQQKTQQEVADMKQEMSEIKQLLKQLINGNTNGKTSI